MPEYTVVEANEQIKKAARYFGGVLVRQDKRFLAATVAGVSIVVAIDDPGEKLRKLIEDDKFFGEGGHMDRPPAPSAPTEPEVESAEVAPRQDDEPPEPGYDPAQGSGNVLNEAQVSLSGSVGVLELRYHVPGSQVWQGSRGAQEGNIHLHVTEDMKLGRRVRVKGECLCSKKHGSNERAPETERKMCEECVKVAEQNGLTWSL